MSLEDGWKHIYACDLAAGLEFEWDYEIADEDDLYEALELMGYEWNGSGWASIKEADDAAIQ